MTNRITRAIRQHTPWEKRPSSVCPKQGINIKPKQCPLRGKCRQLYFHADASLGVYTFPIAENKKNFRIPLRKCVTTEGRHLIVRITRYFCGNFLAYSRLRAHTADRLESSRNILPPEGKQRQASRQPAGSCEDPRKNSI